MVQIAPSILSADFSRLAEDISRAERGGASYIHIDVMDGVFVPNITIGPPVVASLAKSHATALPFDIHLMIADPDRHIQSFVEASTNNGRKNMSTDFISIHAEASTHLHRSIQLIKSFGIRAGVALNPHTPLNVLDHVLDELDLVILMSVNPGFGGQEFLPLVIPKIKQLRSTINEQGLQTEIMIDGGINTSTAPRVVEAGADILVAGSAVFGGELPIEESIRAILSECR